jgi:MFS family permease
MLGMVVLLGLGQRMAERFLPIYILALGGGALAIGLLSGMQNLLGALYSLPGGLLAEHLGTKRALLIFNLMTIAGYLIVIFVPAWWAVIAGAALFLTWSAISQPATMSLVAQALPANKRTMGVSMHSLVRRFPMAVGPLLGGLFIRIWGRVDGVRYAFMVAICLAVIAIIVQKKLIADDRPKEGQALWSALLHPFRMLHELNPSLRNLLVSDILIRFCEMIPDAFVVVWATTTVVGRVDAFQFGVLSTIEMTTAVLIYIPVAYMADRGGKKSFVLATFVFFTAFPLVLYFSRSFWPLVAAFVVRGLKEFGEPTRKSLILDLAPADRRPSTYGFYYMARDMVVSVAAFGGGVLWKYKPEYNLLAAFAFGVIGTAWFALRGKDVATPEAA